MRKLSVVIMVLFCLACLAGCSDDDNPTAAGSTSALVGGTWQGDQEVCDGTSYSLDGIFATFVAGGTGTWVSSGVPADMSWSVSGDQLTITLTVPVIGSSTASGTYSVADDLWTWNMEWEEEPGDFCLQTYNRLQIPD